MSCSKVYFTDFRSYHEEALTHKLQRLMDKAGLGQLDMEGSMLPSKCILESWAIWLFFVRTGQKLLRIM